jgi:hypothetical protein
MIVNGLRALPRAIAVALLMTTAVACSTSLGQSQTSSSEGHIRSWADWASVPNKSGQGN